MPDQGGAGPGVFKHGNFYFDADGNMFANDGTSSRYWHEYMIAALTANPGASGAALVPPSANTLGGYALSNAAHLLAFQVHIESDWDGISDPILEVDFCVNVDNILGAAEDTADLKLQVWYKGEGETVNKTQEIEVPTVVGASARYKQFEAVFTLNHAAVDNIIEAGDNFGMLLNLETDSSEVDNVIITMIEFKYKTTKPAEEI